MTRMPAQGLAVELRDQRGSAHRSVVLESIVSESDHPGTLIMRPPEDLAPERAFEPGTRLLVSWPQDNSHWVLPVLLVELRPAGAMNLLVAEVDDDAWREERRQYARSSLDASLLIDFGAEDEDAPYAISGELVDLSEVALRCVVDTEYREWYQPHMPVFLRIGLGGEKFEINGHVLLAKPAARLDLGLEVVILFHRPVERVEDLRRHLGTAG